MVLCFASSLFGMVSVSTPSLYSAEVLSASTELGSAKLRVKENLLQRSLAHEHGFDGLAY